MKARSLDVIKTLSICLLIAIFALQILPIKPVFATRLFEDGFESGDLSKWPEKGGTPSVTSGSARSGTYKAVLDASEFAQKNMSTGVDHCFIRAYVMFRKFPNSGQETSVLGFWNKPLSRDMAQVKVANVSGTIKWKLKYWNSTLHYYAVSEQQKPVRDKWYCVEVECKSYTTTAAEYRVYINGNELTDISRTGKDNNLKVTLFYMWIDTAGPIIWYDDVIVDTAYIGPQRYLTVASPYGTTGGQGWYNYSFTAYATLNTEEVDHGNGTRHKFNSWSGDASGTNHASSDPITMDANKTATALWATRYLATFTCAGLDSSAQSSIVTVNGDAVNFGQMPYSIWVDAGNSVTYTYSDEVSSSTTGKRFSLVSVSGPTSPVTITGPVSVSGGYKTQYLLSVSTDPAGLEPQPTRDPTGEPEPPNAYWYDTTPKVSLAAQIVDSYTFEYWEIDSIFQGDDVNPIEVTMDGPHAAVAHYALSDIDPPEITIISPENNSYYRGTVPLEFHTNEATEWVAYSLDGPANVTISGNTTIAVGEGLHSIVLFARDLAGNEGRTDIVHFTVRTGVSDVAVVNVEVEHTHSPDVTREVVGQGYTAKANVTVENQGDYEESFDVVLYGNGTIALKQEHVILESGASVILTFTWNTSECCKGSYAISAYATPVPLEEDTSDNTAVTGCIFVSIVGDIIGPEGLPGKADRKVDLRDVFNVGMDYGARLGNWWYNINLDINGDGIVDLKDYFATTRNFGKSW